MSFPPSPPGRLDPKSIVSPSNDRFGVPSKAGVFRDATFVGGDQESLAF
jgi:hypothetical protein